MSLEGTESQTSRASKAVLRGLGFLLRALGSHRGVLSKGGIGSALGFRNTFLALAGVAQLAGASSHN